MERVFVEIAAFRKSWGNQGLNDEELSRLQSILLENPKAGVVIEGTGGLRKIRWSKPPKGKSGSTRVIYVDFPQYQTIYLIYAYSKSERDDLSDEDRARFKKIIEEIERDLKKKH